MTMARLPKPKFGGRRHLDLALAREIIADKLIEAPGRESSADLTAFSRIAPEAIRYLAQFPYAWVDFAIDSLGISLAHEVAAWPASAISFRDGMETTSEALTCFYLCPISLSFGNLGEALDPTAANALITCTGPLELAVDHLETEISAVLAMHHDPLEISVRHPAPPASIRPLANHQGDECRLNLKQPITAELMAALHANPGKRVIDLTRLAGRVTYQTALLLCDETRYAEILSGHDWPLAISMGLPR